MVCYGYIWTYSSDFKVHQKIQKLIHQFHQYSTIYFVLLDTRVSEVSYEFGSVRPVRPFATRDLRIDSTQDLDWHFFSIFCLKLERHRKKKWRSSIFGKKGPHKMTQNEVFGFRQKFNQLMCTFFSSILN